jgi:hypothetical protein
VTSTVEHRQYRKQCRYCSSKDHPVEIFWSDLKRQFTDANGAKHQCGGSSTSQQQVEADKKLNEMLNDIKSQMSNEHNDQVERIDALQRSTARNASILTELKAKIDGVLRGFT